MTKINILFTALVSSFFIFFIGCTAPQVAKTDVPSEKPLTLLFSQQRKLNIEPCGCSMGQLGGLEREYNYLLNLRKNGTEPLYLVGSGGFIPEEKFDLRDLDRYRFKAAVITEAFTKFQVSAFVPDQSDLVIGLKQVQDLSRKYGVPFVSSNLVDLKTAKPVFLEKFTVPMGNTKVLVLGLSGLSPLQNKETRKVKLLDPRAVLRKYLAEEGAGLVAVVHSLEFEDALELMKEFPQVTFWLGGNRTVFPQEVFQYSKTALGLEVQGWGRSLLRVDLNPKGRMAELFEPDQRRFQLGRRRVLAEQKNLLDRGLASNQTELSYIERRLSLLEGLSEKPAESYSSYNFQRVDLATELAGKNELEGLLERSRKFLKN